MSVATPGQAAYEALHASIARRQPAHIWVRWEAVNEINDGIPGEPLREDMEAAAKAVLDLVTPEGIAQAALAAREPQPAGGFRLIADTSGTRHVVDAGGVRQATETGPDAWDLAIAGGNWPAIVQFAKGILGVAGEQGPQPAPGDAERLAIALAALRQIDEDGDNYSAQATAEEALSDIADLSPRLHPQPPAATPSPVLLDAYKGDNRRLRGRIDALLGRFAPDGAGYFARMPATELAQEYRDVPLPVPDQLRHLEEL